MGAVVLRQVCTAVPVRHDRHAFVPQALFLREAAAYLSDICSLGSAYRDVNRSR
jgi:hypothetical protein